jgi:hypothetical protein
MSVVNTKTNFVIVGAWAECAGDFSYWNNELGWFDFEKATPFDKVIIASPLPPGAVGVLEVTNLGETIAFYRMETLPGRDV